MNIYPLSPFGWEICIYYRQANKPRNFPLRDFSYLVLLRLGLGLGLLLLRLLLHLLLLLLFIEIDTYNTQINKQTDKQMRNKNVPTTPALEKSIRPEINFTLSWI